MVMKFFRRKPAGTKKKAQMKIQQMSFLLIAVFILFVLLGMILVSMYMKSVQKGALELQEQNAQLLVSKIANAPEFSCGLVYSSSEKTNCIDADKVLILKESISKYENFWGLSNIEIIKLYPTSIDRECTLQNYPNCNTINLMGNSTASGDAYNFVSLCRKERYNGEIINKCELAKLIVRYEEANT